MTLMDTSSISWSITSRMTYGRRGWINKDGGGIKRRRIKAAARGGKDFAAASSPPPPQTPPLSLSAAYPSFSRDHSFLSPYPALTKDRAATGRVGGRVPADRSQLRTSHCACRDRPASPSRRRQSAVPGGAP